MDYSNKTTVDGYWYNRTIKIEVAYNYTYITHFPDPNPDESIEVTSVVDGKGNDLTPIFNRMDSIFKNNPDYTSVWDRISDAIEPEPPEIDSDARDNLPFFYD